METLYAYSEGALVGTFHRDVSGHVSLEYSPDATTPISLSLPFDSNHQPTAAINYLDGLPPGDDTVRRQWAKTAACRQSFGPPPNRPWWQHATKLL